MSRTFNCTDEIIVVSKGKEDIGKVPALGNDGKLDPSVIPSIDVRQPRCLAYLGISTNIPKGGMRPLGMPTVVYDTDTIHTSEPTKFKINTPGLYLIVQQSGFTTGNNSPLYSGIRKNGGSEYLAMGYGMDQSNISAVAYLNANDYIEPMIAQFLSDTVAVSYAQITITKIGE